MPRFPTLGIVGSKPRFTPSFSRMLKEAEAAAPEAPKRKRKAPKRKRVKPTK